MILTLYKIRKLFREKGQEIIKMTLVLSFACASSFLIALPVICVDDATKRERFEMVITLIIAGFINVMSLLYVDNFQINIIFKIVLGTLLSFLIFLPFIFLIMTRIEYKTLVLDKSEEREAKLLGILWKKK